MAMSDEGTHVLLSRTLETLLESPRGCCLCWQHGQKVFPKLKCRADSLFGRAIKNSLFLFYPNNFFFFFSPSYFSRSYALLSPCPLLPERGRKPSMTDPSFLGWKASPEPQHIDEIQHLREPPTSLTLKPFLERLR